MEIAGVDDGGQDAGNVNTGLLKMTERQQK